MKLPFIVFLLLIICGVIPFYDLVYPNSIPLKAWILSSFFGVLYLCFLLLNTVKKLKQNNKIITEKFHYLPYKFWVKKTLFLFFLVFTSFFFFFNEAKFLAIIPLLLIYTSGFLLVSLLELYFGMYSITIEEDRILLNGDKFISIQKEDILSVIKRYDNFYFNTVSGGCIVVNSDFFNKDAKRIIELKIENWLITNKIIMK